MSPISQSFKANKVHLKYYLKIYIFHIILTHQDEIADAEISLMQQLEIFTFYKFFFCHFCVIRSLHSCVITESYKHKFQIN